MNQADMLDRKQVLQERRKELLGRLKSIQKDYSKGLNSDWEEQAQELENAEVLEEISRVTAEELNKVQQGIEQLEQALARTYASA